MSCKSLPQVIYTASPERREGADFVGGGGRARRGEGRAETQSVGRQEFLREGPRRR